MSVIEMMSGEEIVFATSKYDKVAEMMMNPEVTHLNVDGRILKKSLVAQVKEDKVTWIHKVTDEERAREQAGFLTNVARMGETDGQKQ